MLANKRKTSAPKNICVIQLTRIGDVIQTYMAAKQLKKDHPEANLFLIARKRMASGLNFLLQEVFEEVFYLDVRDFIREANEPIENCLKRIGDFSENLASRELDLVINLSFCKSSSYLATLIPAKHKMGISRNENNQLAVTDKWSQYVYSTVMNSTLNPFNLVDIYKFIMGATTFEPSYEEKPRENKIVVHPFASAKKKRWGMNKWTDLLYKLLKDNPAYDVFVVGGPADRTEGDMLIGSGALKEFQDRLHNLAGSASIKDTYDLLKSSKILVCHDSMVSHLAAVAQTPTVVMSLGTVRPSETTPYQKNVLNIVPRRSCFPCSMESSCELLPCHKDISHQLTGQIVGAILQEKTLDRDYFTKHLSPFYLNNVAVFAPHFGETGLELIDITESAATTEDAFRTFYRILWSFYLRGTDTSYPLPELSNQTLSVLAETQQGCAYIFELYSFGMKYAKTIVEEAKKEDPKIKKIQENIDKLSEIDQLAAVTKKSYPLLKPIVDFFFVNKANALGNNIIDITQSNLLSFYDGQNLVQILFDLIDRTVGPAVKAEKEAKIKEI